MLGIGNEENKGEVTWKLLAEKENRIQLLKRKFNIIPLTQLIHALELTKLEKERELLAKELSNSKARLLKLT